MYIVENYIEAEKVANLLLRNVDFLYAGKVQFIAKDVKNIEMFREPSDLSNIVIKINLTSGPYVLINYYDFEDKCQFSTIYSKTSVLVIGINKFTADELNDYNEIQDCAEQEI